MAGLPSFEEMEKRRKERIAATTPSRSGSLPSYEEVEAGRAKHKAKQVSAGLLSRVNKWLENSGKFVADHNSRFSNRDNSVYVSDSQEWQDSVMSKKKSLDTERISILSDIEKYGKWMDQEWVNSVKEALDADSQTQDKIQSIAIEDQNFWSKFTPTEAQHIAGDTAERLYQDWYKDNSYRQKHQDKSFAQINDAIATLDDGEEKEWLITNAESFMVAEDYDNELVKINDQIQGYQKELNQLINVGGDDYFTKEEISRAQYLQKEIESLSQKKTKYEGKRKYGFISENGDFADTSVYRPEYAIDTGYLSVNGKQLDAKYMTDKELGTFNTIYHQEGEEAAEAYFEYLQPELNARKQDEKRTQKMIYATENPGWASLESVGANLLSGIGYIDALGQRIAKDVSGDYYAPIDYNRAAMTPSIVSSTIRGTVAQNLANDYGVIEIDEQAHPVLSKIFNGKSWGDVYQLGMSMVDSAAVAALSPVLGTAGTALLGGSAATQGMLDAVANGANDEQALAMGLLNGAFEMLFEKVSLESLLSRDTANVIEAMLRQGLAEGSEETFTSIANNVADILIMAEKSGYMKNVQQYRDQGLDEKDAVKQAILDMGINVGWDFVGGMFTGGIMGGSDTVRKNALNMLSEGEQKYTTPEDGVKFSIRNTSSMPLKEQLSKYYKNQLKSSDALYLGETPTALEDAGLTAAPLVLTTSNFKKSVTEKHNVPRRVLNKLSENLQKPILSFGNNGEVGVLIDDIDGDGKPVLVAIHRGSTMDNNPVNEVKSIYGLDNPSLWIQNQVAAGKQYVAFNEEKANAFLRSYGYLASQEDGIRSTGSLTQPMPGVNGENAATVAELARQTVEDQYAAEDTAAEDLGIQSAEGKILLEGNAVQIADVETAGKGKVTVKLTDGRTVDASALEFPDTGEAELWRVVGKYAEDADSAQALLEEYRGGNLDAYKYARGVEEGFLYGKLNISPKQMEMEGSYVNLLNPMQRNMAYRQGVIAGKRQVQQLQAEASRRDPSNRRKGAVHYGYEGETLDESKLNPSQRVGVDFAKRLAERKGMTFYFYRSYMQNGVRVFKNSQGKIVKATKKGWYNPADGSIHVDLNCGDMGSTVLYTIAHELGHHIKDWSAAKFRVLCGIVTEGFVSRGQSVDELVLNKQAEYREMGVELTYEEAYEEVICSAMEGVIDDGRVMELLDLAEKKDMSLAERLRSALRDIADLIRETIEAYRNVEPESPEGRMVMKMGDLRKQIQEAFADALHDAGENYREGGKINTAQTGGTKNSIRTTEDGIKYVKLDGNIFLRPDGTEMSQSEAYTALVGKRITLEDGDTITFIKNLPGRSVYNELFKKLPGYDPGIDVKAVSQAVNKNIVEVITASSVQTRNEPQRHPHVGIVDFDQREVYLADDQNSYRLELCIANLTDGTKIAYVKRFVANTSTEIAKKIKKAETAVQNRLNQPSKSSIRNSNPKVNKNSLRYQKNAAAQSHMAQQNTSMSEDMEGLNQLVAAQQQRGGDGRLQSGALNAAANFLMKTASAKGEKMELIKLLNAFYQHVATSTEQTWESVREQAMPVVRWLMKHAVHTKQRSEYSQDILNHLHGSRISLDDVQKGEVAHLYGSFGAYRNSVMGSVILANDGIPLDSAWQELAEIYPDVFDRDMNAADMPDALADIIYRLRNEDTSELEYEYSREFVEQELLQRVYDSYWNASTLYSVADHYEKQIKQLKGKHNRRMQEVYARHRAAETNQQIIYRQRQEAARAHYEEQYQRREAEHRESRKKAVERHDQTQMRQKIKRVVRDLWKLQERAPKHRRTKEELRSFVDSAIKAADLIWLERYDEYDMIRNGIDDKYLRGDEKRLLEECRELLEKHLEISDADIDTRWDIDSALQQAKDKAALDKELAKRMKILRDNGVFAEEFKRLHEMDAGQILKDLLDSYKKLQSTDSPYLANAYQEKIQIRLQEIIDDIGIKPIRNMTLQELEKLYEAYNGVLHVVRDANKLFADERAGEITTLGTRIVNEMDGFSRKAMGRKFMETLRQTGWSNLTPAYVFRHLGSGTLERLYKNMVKGMGTYGHDIAEAKEHWQKQAKKHGAFDWDMDKRTEFVDKTGTKFSLSLGQLMSLYALSRRQQALGHLEIGGIRLDAEENYVENVVDRVLPKVMRDASVFKLDKAALSAICSKLTPEQKAFVETTQGYLSTVMAEKGNDVSMKLYGIRLFREKIYFPLRTANDTRYQSTELIDQNKLKNSGFTKETNPDANNAVVLSDYSKVWTSHVKKMSLYHGMTLPMEDMDRMLNFGRTFARDENGNIRRDKDGNPVEEFEGDSISATMRNIWGEHPENYLRDMMKQLNGGVRSDAAEDLPGKMLSRFKKSAVAGSLSVWIQQWTSVFRSMAYIPMKHFFQKPMGKQRTAIVEEMKKHCPIAIIKEMGGFDTGMGNSEHDYITMRDPENAKELIQEIKKHPVKRFDELTGWLPGRADETTWAHIWTAVKRETLENHPELKRGSDEFYKAASDRFTEVINLTQVYDSVLSKSALMRSKGFGAKMITQFASEPTVALNMAVDAMLQQHRTGKLQVGTAFALVGSVVANAMSSALIYAMRDDDEEETFWEKYSASMLGNLLDGLNPLTYIPIIRDIWSAAQGYDVKRSDMEIWGQVLSSLEELVRKYNDEDATDKERAEAWAGAADWILALFGVPAKNIRREMKGFGNLWRTLEADYDRETTARSMGDVIQDTWWSSIPLLRLIKGETKAKKLMDAYMTGDTKYADRLRGTYKTEDSANNAVVKEIQSRFKDGKLTDNQVIEYLTKYAGKTDEKAQDYLTKWRFAMENPDTVLEDSQFLKYTEFAEPAGISQEIYAQYAAEIKACESDKDENGKTIVGSKKKKVLDVINALPISDAQKDALYLENGYDEDKLKDAPWN